MSYATMRDVLFALDLSDSELRDRPRRHPDVPAAEPELPEERGERRRAGSKGASMRSPASRGESVEEQEGGDDGSIAQHHHAGKHRRGGRG